MSRQRSQLNPVQSSASSHLSQKNCRIWNHKHSRSSKRKWHHWIGPDQEPSISQNSHVCSSDCSSLWSSPHWPVCSNPSATPPTRSRYWRSLIKQNFWELQKITCDLDHKTSLKSLGYICSNSQKYIVWVKIIDFSFMPKIIRTLSKDHVPWRYFVNFLL